ncbi:MAG: AMP-dependent synthetase/ligase, partial [Thiohalospira sp.]
MSIADVIAGRSVPGDQPAVVTFGRASSRTTTRDELFERAGRLAAGLDKAGLERGGRVVLMAPNSVDWIVSALGVMNAGGVVVPLDTQMPGEDLAHALGDCDPAFIFTTATLRERIDALDVDLQARVCLLGKDEGDAEAWSALLAPEPTEPVETADDLAAIFYTSGTTGPPKGVPLTHRNLASNVEALGEQGLADHRDRVLVPLPFHHVYPFTVGILIPLSLGATIITPFSLVGPQIVRALREGKATVMLGVPGLYEAMYRALEERIAGRGRLAAALFHGLLGMSMAARRRLGWRAGGRLFAPVRKRLAPDLRLMAAGGAALDPDLGRRLQALGWEVATGYGLSETSPILTFNTQERMRLESAGIALPGVELRIDAREGEGEILARGPNVFDGYWNRPEKTAEDLDDDGWFHTGDIGELDDDGYLYLHGRRSSMIVLPGGENVDPDRVEKALAASEGIREA